MSVCITRRRYVLLLYKLKRLRRAESGYGANCSRFCANEEAA